MATRRAGRLKAAPWPVLLSVGVAFAFALGFPALVVDDSPGYLDPARAWAAGQGLREGNGHPLQYRLPLFPLALGVTIRLFGEDPRAFTLMNVGFLVLAALVVRRALLRRGLALADGVAVAILVYPPLLTSAALVLHTLLGGTVSNRIDNWNTFPEYVEARREWEQSARAEEPVLDRHLARVALRRIAAHPARWLGLCAERAIRFMLPARTWFVQAGLSRTGTFGPTYLIATAFNVTLFALAAWLSAHALRKRDLALLVGPVIVFGHLAAYAVVYSSPRYGVTVGPVLIAAAGLALAEIRRGRQRLGATTAAEGAPAAP